MLNIVTALLCETRPIISKLKLKLSSHKSPFKIYQNDQINLIISGVGKVSSANAIGYLYANNNSVEQTSAWLNIGIAGHSSFEINTGFLANKIIDKTTEQTWYPPIIFDQPCCTDKLMTVDKPGSEYTFNGGVDMEASAFYASASRYTTNELIHSYKVVSDNPNSPLHKITPAQASELISSNIEDIQFLIDQLLIINNELSSTTSIPIDFKTLKKQIRMTHSEQLKIKNLLSKLNIINSNLTLDFDQFIEIASSENLISYLDNLLKKQEIYF